MKRYVVFALACACHSSEQAPQATPVASVASIAPSATAAAPAPVEDAGDARRALIDAWNAANNSHDSKRFDSLYADQVLFYKARLDRGVCMVKKDALFMKAPDFTQKLRDVRIEETDAGVARATFVSTVTAGGKTRDYPSYLELERRGTRWVIVTEGDTITDRNLAGHCTAIAWTGQWPYEAEVSLVGRLTRADGVDTTGGVEHYFRLTLDKPACMPSGYDVAESRTVQAYAPSAVPIDLGAFVDKHMKLAGSAFVQHTAHHHEPLLIAVSAGEVVP